MKKFFVIGILLAQGAIFAEQIHAQKRADGDPYVWRSKESATSGPAQCEEVRELIRNGISPVLQVHPTFEYGLKSILTVYASEMNDRPKSDWWVNPQGEPLQDSLTWQEVAFMLTNHDGQQWSKVEPAQWTEGQVKIGQVPKVIDKHSRYWLTRGPYSGEYVLTINGVPVASCNCMNAIRVMWDQPEQNLVVDNSRRGSDPVVTSMKEPGTQVTVTVNNYIVTPPAMKQPEMRGRYNDLTDGCGNCGMSTGGDRLQYYVEERNPQYVSRGNNLPSLWESQNVVCNGCPARQNNQYVRTAPQQEVVYVYDQAPQQNMYVQQQPTRVVQYPPQTQQPSMEELWYQERMARKMRRRQVGGQFLMYAGANIVGGFAQNLGGRFANQVFGKWGAPIVQFAGNPTVSVGNWPGPSGGFNNGIEYWGQNGAIIPPGGGGWQPGGGFGGGID